MEIPLGDKDACRLIATNVYSLVSNPFTGTAHVDKDIAYSYFYESQVVADTLVDIELEHIKRIVDLDDEAQFWQEVYDVGFAGRRTGTGVMRGKAGR